MSTSTDEMWKRDEAHIREAMARQAASAGAPSKSAGPVSSLGVVGGSLSVSSAEDFALWLTHMIDLYTQLSEAEFLRGNTHEELKMGNYAVAFRTALTRFRRHMADANVRQPEENIAGLPRAGNAATPTPSTQSNP